MKIYFVNVYIPLKKTNQLNKKSLLENKPITAFQYLNNRNDFMELKRIISFSDLSKNYNKDKKTIIL